jgi:L-iditol 2-dehydrogenase
MASTVPLVQSLVEQISVKSVGQVNVTTKAMTESQSPPSERRNPSLQVTADHRVKMVEAPIEEPTPGTVLLHIKATGICG